MKTRTILAGLLILCAPGAEAGSITYTWHPLLPDNTICRLVVDEAAWIHGAIARGDVRSFTFGPTGLFTADDIGPYFGVPIDSAGIPTDDTGIFAIAQGGPAPGSSLTMDFGVSSFQVGPTGSWSAQVAGSHGESGQGYWTAELHVAPEPSSLAMGGAAVVTLLLIRGLSTWRSSDRRSRRISPSRP